MLCGQLLFIGEILFCSISYSGQASLSSLHLEFVASYWENISLVLYATGQCLAGVFSPHGENYNFWVEESGKYIKHKLIMWMVVMHWLNCMFQYWKESPRWLILFKFMTGNDFEFWSWKSGYSSKGRKLWTECFTGRNSIARESQENIWISSRTFKCSKMFGQQTSGRNTNMPIWSQQGYGKARFQMLYSSE